MRRRLLCLPIGVFCGLVLSGAFTNDELFWWPFLGTVVRRTTRSCPRSWVVMIEELVGLVVCWVARRPVRPLPARAPPRVPPHRPAAGLDGLTESSSGRGLLGADGDADARRLRGAGVRAVGVDDEATFARAVGDRHAERVEERVVLLGGSPDRW